MIIISVIYSFLIPKTYKATATITLPQDGGMGGLSSLLSSGGGALSFGAELLGMGVGGAEDLVLGILYSRSTLTKVVQKYDLFKYYGKDQDDIDLTLKSFMNDIIFEPNEFGLIAINVINEDPELSAFQHLESNVQKREMFFIKNSIKGYLQYLKNQSGIEWYPDFLISIP